MNDGQLWSALRRGWLLVLLFLLLGLALSVAYVRVAPTKYTAQADLYVSTVGSLTVSELSAGSTVAQAQARNLALIATRDRVLGPVANQLRLDRSASSLSNSVSATVPSNTSVIQLEVTDASPDDAASIANAVASSLVNATGDLLPPTRRGAPSIQVQVVQPAVVPAEPSGPNVGISVLLGVALGLLVGMAVALVADARRARRAAGAPNQRRAAVSEPPTEESAHEASTSRHDSEWSWAPERS